jgi:hypothetical protein
VTTIESNCLPTVRRISNNPWDKIRLLLPPEKPANTMNVTQYPLGRFWMALEDVADAVWFRFDLSWKIPTIVYISYLKKDAITRCSIPATPVVTAIAMNSIDGNERKIVVV